MWKSLSILLGDICFQRIIIDTEKLKDTFTNINNITVYSMNKDEHEKNFKIVPLSC